MISGEPLPSAFPGADWESVAPETQGVEPAVLNEALQLMAAACGPLGARRAVVVRGGRIIWSGGDENVRVPVYSCTKSFLSACLKNSICFVIPSWRMTLVRVGPDVIVWPREFEPAFARLAAALR